MGREMTPLVHRRKRGATLPMFKGNGYDRELVRSPYGFKTMYTCSECKTERQWGSSRLVEQSEPWLMCICCNRVTRHWFVRVD